MKDAYDTTSEIIGFLAAAAVFIGVYIGAAASAGWVIGLALGWIPAGIAAALSYPLTKALWPLILIGIIWAFASMT